MYKLILYLNIPKGKTGDAGPRGKASRIGEVRATVDEKVGDPDVSVDYDTIETND